ncbi:MAG: glycosyltransferase family 2 protein [Verrucomicrobia bacterium]|nr:glycosyltransferase family 2 protein [Verrucomicrobiota bacterium]
MPENLPVCNTADHRREQEPAELQAAILECDEASFPEERLECEISIVIPCLNEAQTVGTCVAKAIQWIKAQNLNGEVIVADNGSTDGSQMLAERAGARVIPVSQKGYGSALMGGIESARGQYVIMGDADDSYDLLALDSFLFKLRAGFDLAQGCRLPSGGGKIMAEAMPFLHRWWGNPMFSFLARFWFGAPIHDVNCGLRGFSKTFYQRLEMQCTGMEFAVEMIIKASLLKAKITEVPVILYKDGRTNGRPHLRTFRDGWRTLRFFLMFSPRWLFLIPGLVLMTIGLILFGLLLPGTLFIGRIGLDIHSLLFASLFVIVGFDAVAFALLTRVFANAFGFLPSEPALSRLNERLTLEGGLLLSSALLLLGLLIAGYAFFRWSLVHFGPLDSRLFVRLVVTGTTLLTLGAQVAFGTFFLSILNLRRR